MRLSSSPALILRSAAACLLLFVLTAAAAQISVPTFGTRGGVPAEAVDSFMAAFRAEVGKQTGLEVRSGELITPGIASSLEPEFTILIAELDSARYAVSGEIAAVLNANGEPYAVNLIVVDAERGRATDLITQPWDPRAPAGTVTELAAAVARFTSAIVELPRGDAGLFVSSEPRDAQVFIDGVSIGHTSRLDVAMLAPGRYRLELRKDGFLPDARMIELRSGDTSFVHVVLTAISGGSIQVAASPSANVLLDGVPSGTTPVTLPALPGTHRVTLRRPGFQEESYEVLVRNYRVSRLDVSLAPATEPLIYWAEQRPVLIFIDGRLQPGAFAEGVKPGLRTFELVRGAESRSFLRAVPDRGVFELDLTSGELIPRHR